MVETRGIGPRSDALQAPATTTLAQSPLVGRMGIEPHVSGVSNRGSHVYKDNH